MIYMFYKYPFVTEWKNDWRNPVYNNTKLDLGNRMKGVKSPYVIVDDGQSCMVVEFEDMTKEVPPVGYYPRITCCYLYHITWMLRALDYVP